jgi:hypothetical protein
MIHTPYICHQDHHILVLRQFGGLLLQNDEKAEVVEEILCGVVGRCSQLDHAQWFQ